MADIEDLVTKIKTEYEPKMTSIVKTIEEISELNEHMITRLEEYENVIDELKKDNQRLQRKPISPKKTEFSLYERESLNGGYARIHKITCAHFKNRTKTSIDGSMWTFPYSTLYQVHSYFRKTRKRELLLCGNCFLYDEADELKKRYKFIK